jgi:hypothetical protein
MDTSTLSAKGQKRTWPAADRRLANYLEQLIVADAKALAGCQGPWSRGAGHQPAEGTHR